MGLDTSKPLVELDNEYIEVLTGVDVNETFFASPSASPAGAAAAGAAGGRASSPTPSALSQSTTTGTPDTLYKNATDIQVYKNGLAAGLNPPRRPAELPEFRSANPKWAEHFNEMNEYNLRMAADPNTNLAKNKFRITARMKFMINVWNEVGKDEKVFRTEMSSRITAYNKLPKDR